MLTPPLGQRLIYHDHEAVRGPIGAPLARLRQRASWHDAAMKRITILGSTGSIGTQTLEVARWRGYQVAALAAGTNSDLLLAQAHEFKPELVSCAP